MTKPMCSLSLDLDNLWSYMKVHGDEGWAEYPSYLDVFVPRFLEFAEQRKTSISVFIVGRDATIEGNKQWLKMIADAGHEICNHSHHHEPWLHLYTKQEIIDELSMAEAAIEDATGVRPRGFRGPGFSFSQDVLSVLSDRGYDYDASTFPTFIGPLARLYYFRTAKLSREDRAQRAALFGSVKEVFRSNKPYIWKTQSGDLIEIPVTTIPMLRSPFHFSYLIFLAEKSPRLAHFYLSIACTMCRMTGTQPSILLHPLDFLGPEDAAQLEFFPGMHTPAPRKLAWMHSFFDRLERQFRLVPMGKHAAELKSKAHLLPIARLSAAPKG